MKYTEINIKQNMPLVADAMRYLQGSIAKLKQDKCECMLIIHGYGSTGKGGAICEKARQWLKAQERNGKFKTITFGKDFALFNFKALELKTKYQNLEQFICVQQRRYGG